MNCNTNDNYRLCDFCVRVVAVRCMRRGLPYTSFNPTRSHDEFHESRIQLQNIYTSLWKQNTTIGTISWKSASARICLVGCPCALHRGGGCFEITIVYVPSIYIRAICYHLHVSQTSARTHLAAAGNWHAYRHRVARRGCQIMRCAHTTVNFVVSFYRVVFECLYGSLLHARHTTCKY